MVISDSPLHICFFIPFLLTHQFLTFPGPLPGAKHKPNWIVGTGPKLTQFDNTVTPALLGTTWRAWPCQGGWKAAGLPPWTRGAYVWKGELEGTPYLPLSTSHSETHWHVCFDTQLERRQCNSLIFAFLGYKVETWRKMTKKMLLLLPLISLLKIYINICFGLSYSLFYNYLLCSF